MMDLLRDPVWQFVGLVLAVLTSVPLLKLYERIKSKDKSLLFSWLDGGSIASINSNGRRFIEATDSKGQPLLQISYDGKCFTSALGYTKYELKNNGRSDLTIKDFEPALIFEFKKNVEILAAEIYTSNMNNPDSKIDCIPDGNTISFRMKPNAYWEKGEWIRFNLLIAGNDSGLPRRKIDKQKDKQINVINSIVPRFIVRLILLGLIFFSFYWGIQYIQTVIGYILSLPTNTPEAAITLRIIAIATFSIFIVYITILPSLKKLAYNVFHFIFQGN